jgi:hypothetical protein
LPRTKRKFEDDRRHGSSPCGFRRNNDCAVMLSCQFWLCVYSQALTLRQKEGLTDRSYSCTLLVRSNSQSCWGGSCSLFKTRGSQNRVENYWSIIVMQPQFKSCSHARLLFSLSLSLSLSFALSLTHKRRFMKTCLSDLDVNN